ncbi:RluA family pseudouridine synthase [Aliterella atlantica]|uniref:RNA pseudouridylate synthase n=1 Tax=Aliterella atlantica CENA595 TaxID=1618023 RepID=A0A0D8ZR02_9CYAN|nr:RluA family pseudouridine synthase [Aliterella atlantica]KJH70767.1 pseudouridine synthase [Aliterella atlantica CENA595]
MTVTYWYEGHCPQSGKLLGLPRTPLVEAIASELMQHLASNEMYAREGKMYGVLLGETQSGQQVIKAFSGLLNGKSTVEGWVPPIPGRDTVALEEACTLASLEALKQELIALQEIPEQRQYELLLQEYEKRSHALTLLHSQRQQARQHQRQILNLADAALEQLNEQSRQDGIERKLFKRERDAVLQPLKAKIEAALNKRRKLKQKRKTLSKQLQAQMHANYWLTNFAGESAPLQELMPTGMPTGTGECCAPKLLHYAATMGLKPLAMAEFWWGSSSADKVQGQFYGACVERCQPLMGFLLSGLSQQPIVAVKDSPLTILYEDEWLIAVNKPSGLLSVPGRYRHLQDSVLGRLRHIPDIATVHRLDCETSGILILARDRQTHRHLSKQFQQRQVHKVYEAVLAGIVDTNSGAIDLPLWGDPTNRPYQQVNWQQGKPSLTRYQRLSTIDGYTRMEFLPLTGRSHQIRVHAADKQGLGIHILGDRLYGCQQAANRLHLHARELTFAHPHSGKTVFLQVETPF